MRSILMPFIFTLVAVTLLPAGLSWNTKAVSEWDEQDAKQVLGDSPWVKNAVLQKVPDLSESERRDSGNWEAGIAPGVGLAGLGVLGAARKAEALARAHAHPDLGTVVVRWESAVPVHAAELKLGETSIPAWQGNYYAIAVYDVPPPFRWNLANELKNVSVLKRDNKRDLKPKRVEVLWHDNGLVTVVYLFSRSAEITGKDLAVRFQAQIGRLLD